MIINRRLLKELTLQQDLLNSYIPWADVQQGVFTAEAAPTMLDGELAHGCTASVTAGAQLRKTGCHSPASA